MTTHDDALSTKLLDAAGSMPGIRRDEADKAVLVAVLTALLGIGAVMVYSTMTRGDQSLLGWQFVRQILYMIVGACMAVILAKIDYRFLIRYHRVLLIASLVLLVLVLVPGVGARINGARRWFRIGTISFQPSEMAKFAVVIFLAGYIAQKRDQIREFKIGLLPALCVVGVTCALVVKEPDLGTTALIAAVSWVMLFIGGARLIYVVVLPIIASPAALLVLHHFPHAWKRVVFWLHPELAPKGAGYHVIQSLIAVGSGGISGVGMGASSQKLMFLPESSSDFVFAILAEEMGLFGVSIVIALYLAFILVGVTIARRASDMGGRLLAAGITSIVAIQAVINICVVTQVLPTKGIALPFISAGGSAVVFMIAGTGILYSVAAHRDPSADN